VRLPAVTNDWRGFGFAFWQRRWSAQRDDDRRRAVLAWIDGIERTSRPGLHVLHVLLPHEPFTYLPSGQIGAVGAGHPPGLDAGGTWSSDHRLVALNYQQHLRQVQFVDELLGLAMERLESLGLFD